MYYILKAERVLCMLKRLFLMHLRGCFKLMRTFQCLSLPYQSLNASTSTCDSKIAYFLSSSESWFHTSNCKWFSLWTNQNDVNFVKNFLVKHSHGHLWFHIIFKIEERHCWHCMKLPKNRPRRKLCQNKSFSITFFPIFFVLYDVFVFVTLTTLLFICLSKSRKK